MVQVYLDSAVPVHCHESRSICRIEKSFPPATPPPYEGSVCFFSTAMHPGLQ